MDLNSEQRKILERERERPEGLGEDEEAGEAEGVGGVVEEEAGAVAEISGVGRGMEEAGEVGGGEWVVEDVLTDEEIRGVHTQRDGVDVERGPA